MPQVNCIDRITVAALRFADLETLDQLISSIIFIHLRSIKHLYNHKEIIISLSVQQSLSNLLTTFYQFSPFFQQKLVTGSCSKSFPLPPTFVEQAINEVHPQMRFQIGGNKKS